MLTSVAFCVCHVSVVDCPAWIESGFAESDAVGAGGGGGGGGGGAAFFFAHPTIKASAAAQIKMDECFLTFNVSSCKKMSLAPNYLKLQFGC
jgi:hypothetical protein